MGSFPKGVAVDAGAYLCGSKRWVLLRGYLSVQDREGAMEPTELMELTLPSLRDLFQKQLMLTVEEALGVIHDAQRLMAQEKNLVLVRSSACVHGTSVPRCPT